MPCRPGFLCPHLTSPSLGASVVCVDRGTARPRDLCLLGLTASQCPGRRDVHPDGGVGAEGRGLSGKPGPRWARDTGLQTPVSPQPPNPAPPAGPAGDTTQFLSRRAGFCPPVCCDGVGGYWRCLALPQLSLFTVLWFYPLVPPSVSLGPAGQLAVRGRGPWVPQLSTTSIP